jgi:hypothetical protein
MIDVTDDQGSLRHRALSPATEVTLCFREAHTQGEYTQLRDRVGLPSAVVAELPACGMCADIEYAMGKAPVAPEELVEGS